MDEHFSELERRLNILENSVARIKSEFPPAVEELKIAVEEFRLKLKESQSYSSWIGNNLLYNNNMGLPGHQGTLASVHPYWRHVKYRRKVQDEVEQVVSRYKQLKTEDITEDAKIVLRLPSFNTWVWEDAELLLMLQHMYEDLNLTENFSIDLDCLRAFLCNMYLNYNQVPFHNFRHAFSVAQMMYGMICKCYLESKLSSIDILILLTSCVCHDLDHPGFNNIYQINAKTELALRYNDISPLENHHCAIAFQILEKYDCNIFRNLSTEDYKRIREGMIRCILATDMARHNEILQDFRDATPIFNYDNKTHTNLLFMILIKVADISNEARPLDIAEPWLECLMQEFFNQSDLEKLEGLPVSPFMDREKVTKPSSQCSFIGFVLLPLFEALGEVLPHLQDLLIEPVRDALEHYRRLNELTKKLSDDKDDVEIIDDEEEVEKEDVPERIVKCGRSSDSSPTNLKKILSKTESFTSLKSRTSSRTSGLMRAASSRDTDPDSTETEVEVSERISKFKISTDASRRNSYDRKASIDRRFSVEKTVTPKMLEERLRTHNEAEAEHQQLQDENSGKHEKPVRQQSESFLSKIKHLSERLTNEKVEEDSSRSSENSSPNVKLSKRKKETVDNESKLSSSSSADKMRIKFASTAMDKQNDSVDEKISINSPNSNQETPVSKVTSTPPPSTKKINLASASCGSPTISEKNPCSPNTFLRHKKKFSLSLDILQKRNCKSKKDQASISESQRVLSDDVFASSQSCQDNCSKSHHNSPKTLKKKHESAATILLRSISFRKKSSTKDHHHDSLNNSDSEETGSRQDL